MSWITDTGSNIPQAVPSHPISSTQAFLALFKAVVGPSILYLPAAIKNAGLATAVPITFLTGLASTIAVCLLLQTASELRRQGHSIVGIGDIGAAAFGKIGRTAVSSAVVLAQLGFCTGYCVFVGENVQAVIFEAYGGSAGARGDGAPCDLPSFLSSERLVYWIIIVAMPLLIPLTWIRNLRSLSMSNFIASILLTASVLFMFVILSLHVFSYGAKEVELAVARGTLTYVGTAMFAFEGIGVVLPVEQSMANPSEMPAVVWRAMGCACSLQLIFGVLAYLAFGAHTQPIVTVSIGDGSVFLPGGAFAVQAVQIAWIVSVYLTFPLQMLPAARILEGSFAAESRSGRKAAKNVLRSGLVLLCMLVSIFGYSSVDNLVAIIGALACIPLAMVYPALFHFKVMHWPACSESSLGAVTGSTRTLCSTSSRRAFATFGRRQLASAFLDLLIVGGGSVGLVLALFMAVQSWILTEFSPQVCIVPDSRIQ